MFRRTLTALLLLAAIAAAAPAARAQVVAGPFTFSDTNHKYYIVRVANWGDYTTAAANLGGYPVVINEAAENDFIRQVVLPSIPAPWGYAYIGYSDPSASGDYRWTAGVVDTYTNWAAGEPNNSGGTEHYGSIYKANGTWNDVPAPPPDNGNGLAPAIVEVNQAVGGPTGILFGPVAAPDSGNVYYVTTAGTWWAQELFAERILHGHLASVESAAEQSFITKAILPVANIGSAVTLDINASTLNTPAFYFWYAGPNVNYSHYAPGEPNNPTTEPIVTINTTGNNAGLWYSAPDVARPAIIKVKRCPGDFNKNGTVEVQDIFDFLSAWFAACP